MGRNEQLIRQWQIIRKLVDSRYGITIDELAEIMEVSTRTIRRDLDCLMHAGFPLELIARDNLGAWRLCRDELARLISLIKNKA